MNDSTKPTSTSSIKPRPFLILCILGVVSLLIFSIVPRLVLSQSTTEETIPLTTSAQPEALASAPSLGSVLFRLMVGTAILGCCCAGMIYGTNRWLKPKTVAQNGPMKLIATLPINFRCSIHLVQVGDQQLLVGVDGSGLKSMITLPETLQTPTDIPSEEPIVFADRIRVLIPDSETK